MRSERAGYRLAGNTDGLTAIVCCILVLTSCNGPAPEPAREAVQTAEMCEAGAARSVVERLGERMKRVSLMAADSVVRRELRDAYAELVTADLLSSWASDPSHAPGRLLSSPWPERIDVRSVAGEKDGSCTVLGEVVFLTSTEAAGGEGVRRESVRLRVVGPDSVTGGEDRYGGMSGDGWRVAAYETPSPGPVEVTSSADSAVDVIRRYYAAIRAQEYRRAYELWGEGGAASGQTFDEFAAGFTGTAAVAVEVGDAGRIEGAAGSRFIRIPVVVRATTVNGDRQRFEGTYTLRRSVVDGATDEEREWHIHTAALTRTP